MRRMFEKFMKNVWPSLKTQLIQHLKGKAVKLALKTFLKTGAGAGFKAWLIKFVVEELIEEVAIPVANGLEVEVKFMYDTQVGKVLAKRVNHSRENGDAQTYNDAADDIMG